MTNVMPPLDESNPQPRAFSILAQIARARCQVYHWLALGFYAPDEKLWRALNSQRAMDEIETATLWLGQDRKMLQDSIAKLRNYSVLDLGAQSNEFDRLFGKSAERISTRESMYRWRETSNLLESTGDLARSLRQYYGQFGVVPEFNQEDQLAMQLEFMMFLCERESAEWSRNNSEAARLLRRQERAFLDDHLARWFPEFCWRVTDLSKDSIYSALAQLTDAWLKLEYGPGYTVVR